MKRAFLILGICFAVLALAFMVTLIVSSVEVDYARDHYQATYVNRKSGEYSWLYSYGSGCGEMSCKYCNGKSYQKEYGDFVFYRTMSSLKTASIVIFSVFGFFSVASFTAPVALRLIKKEK